MLRIDRNVETGDMKIPVLLFKMLNQEFVFLKEKNSGILYFSDLKMQTNDLSSGDVFHSIEEDNLKLIAKRVIYDGDLNNLRLVIDSEMVSMPVDSNAMPTSWEIMLYKSELGIKYKELE